MRATNIRKCLEKDPKVHPYPKITYKSKHELSMKTWENHSGQLGGYLNRCWLDECADFESDQVFKVLQPMLADKRGLMFCTGTVTTETSFIWDMYLRGQTSNPRFKSWRYTWKDAMVFQGKAGYLELCDAYETMSFLDFMTQYEVIPVGDDSTAFPKLKRCEVDVEPPPGPQNGRRYCMAADLARTKDHTYVVIIDDTGLVVYEEEFQKGLDYAVYAEKCARLARFWQVGDAFTIDATGCGGSGGQRTTEDSIVKIYRAAYPDVRPFTWSGNSESQSKHQVVQFFACLTEEKSRHQDAQGNFVDLPKLRIPRRFEKLLRQLGGYRLKVSKTTGQLTYMGRFGHDDGASACILACWRAFKHKLFGKTVGQSSNDPRMPRDLPPIRHINV